MNGDFRILRGTLIGIGVLVVGALFVVGCASGPRIGKFWDNDDLKKGAVAKTDGSDSDGTSTDATAKDDTKDSSASAKVASTKASDTSIGRVTINDLGNPPSNPPANPAPVIASAKSDAPSDAVLAQGFRKLPTTPVAPTTSRVVQTSASRSADLDPFADDAPAAPHDPSAGAAPRKPAAPAVVANLSPPGPQRTLPGLPDPSVDDAFAPSVTKPSSTVAAKPSSDRLGPAVASNENARPSEVDPFAEQPAPPKTSAVATDPSTDTPTPTSKGNDAFAGMIDQQLHDIGAVIAQQEPGQTANPARQAAPTKPGSVDTAKQAATASTAPTSDAFGAPEAEAATLTAGNQPSHASTPKPASALADPFVESTPTVSAQPKTAKPTATADDAFVASDSPRSVQTSRSSAASSSSAFESTSSSDGWSNPSETPKRETSRFTQTASTSSSRFPVGGAVVNEAQDTAFSDSSAPAAPQAASSTMILDSSSVRGRFTGMEVARRSVAPPPPENDQRTSSIADARSNAFDSDSASSPVQTTSGSDVPTDEPKRLSPRRLNVINAVARHSGRTSGDEFVASSSSNRAVSISATEENSGDVRRSFVLEPPPKPLKPEALEIAKTSAVPAPPAPTMAPAPPVETTSGKAEAWFAIGMALGLAASVGLWIRMRAKIDAASNS